VWIRGSVNNELFGENLVEKIYEKLRTRSLKEFFMFGSGFQGDGSEATTLLVEPLTRFQPVDVGASLSSSPVILPNFYFTPQNFLIFPYLFLSSLLTFLVFRSLFRNDLQLVLFSLTQLPSPFERFPAYRDLFSKSVSSTGSPASLSLHTSSTRNLPHSRNTESSTTTSLRISQSQLPHFS